MYEIASPKVLLTITFKNHKLNPRIINVAPVRAPYCMLNSNAAPASNVEILHSHKIFVMP
jgi:hypothetical protein